MSDDRMRVDFSETTVARVNTTVQGFIDDFYASVDVNYTPSAMKISADMTLVVTDGATPRTFRATFNWYEDAVTINTRIKNIFAAFTAGLTSMEGSSSYTTVVTLSGSVILTVTYT